MLQKYELSDFVAKFDNTMIWTPQECGVEIPMHFDFEYIDIVIKTTVDTCDVIELSGFHHDPNGALQKSGLIEYTITKPKDVHGCYEIEWRYGNYEKFKPSSMFPDHWSREQIPEKVLESIHNYTDAQPSKNFANRFEITGTTSEGIEIFSIVQIEGKVATIVTYYPNVKT